MPLELNAAPIINAVGYATRVSGTCLHPEVIAAMAQASGRCFEIDDLLAAAYRAIQQATGAEAGIVTCGAGAALTLAAAACLAGNDPEIMDRLPDTSLCRRSEIILPKPGPFDYDHAFRLSGAKAVFIDYAANDVLAKIERAIGERTAAIGYVWHGLNERPRVEQLVELAHSRALPVIVDAAYSLPPVDNLTSFIARGADLVAFSGGKHLGGPQASGILCGRAELVRSAWVQMVDMDVRQGTWSLEHWVRNDWIARAPRHGVGRSMKVSKEAIVGLLAALERYGRRDHAAEYLAWMSAAQRIYDGLRDLKRLRIELHAESPNGQPIPQLTIESNGLSVRELLLALRALPRKIILAEDERSPDLARIVTQTLQDGDAEEIVAAIRKTAT